MYIMLTMNYISAMKFLNYFLWIMITVYNPQNLSVIGYSFYKKTELQKSIKNTSNLLESFSC